MPGMLQVSGMPQQPAMPQVSYTPPVTPQMAPPQVSYTPPVLPQMAPPQVTVPPVPGPTGTSNVLLIAIFCLLAFLVGGFLVYLLVKK